ncbi:MAG: class I SAM-dependent methyltransferase [Nitrospira sp.]|nr:class I SAM-dependent methyltransferase [Nitrospira sp.]
MASLSPEQVIEGQRQDWNRVAGGWEKWDRFFDEQMAFLNHRLVGDARLRAGLRVLDLGSGTGYPAILAAQVVGANGGVVGIDLAQQMLDAAGRKASALELSNVTFRTGDVTTLPFESASFDAVTTRFCLMFLPDIAKAAAEIARILKPNTWMAAAVWSTPEKNPYLKIPIDIIKQFIELPPPDPQRREFSSSEAWRARSNVAPSGIGRYLRSRISGGRPVFRGRGLLLQSHGHCGTNSKFMGSVESGPTDRCKTAHHPHSRAISQWLGHRLTNRRTNGHRT